MSATLKLFERWKAAKQHSSDRQALLALGVSHGAAVHWKAGRNADADLIERMAKDLGENPAAWAALAMSEQAKGEAARAWKRMARQLGAAASVAVVALFAHPATVIAAPSAHAEQTHDVGIMRNHEVVVLLSCGPLQRPNAYSQHRCPPCWLLHILPATCSTRSSERLAAWRWRE